ncbi:Small-conductance mechanosensitive channel [Loktanella fryxellensis]|uniref:Small-conductance mechanosensitive channel n=1 Tax=Loktanella fryxellensis TaxID=245187 RepID=A0A1H8I0M1_9RHOB|nr:DUF3772 domain-containing protein [Loktanella fryxellensis]SEN61804.1 Small-conductance mechanosensitive channel [Loktanella fryxellensis]
MALRQVVLTLAVALSCGLWAQGAVAQISLDGLLGTTEEPAADPAASETVVEETPADEEAAEVAEDAALLAAQAALAAAIPDLADWESRVAAAEELLRAGTGSQLNLTRTREALFGWRDRFQTLGAINGGRMSTVQAQIDALGQPAEGAEEQPAIAARRAALTAQLDDLRAPGILAREAYARANGLIAEVDSQLRTREAARLTARGASPLSPAAWPAALSAAHDAFVGQIASSVSRMQASAANGGLLRNGPFAVVYLGVAAVLLLQSRRWVALLQGRVERGRARMRAVWSFLLSLWQIVLPTVGLSALILGLRQIGVLARSGDTISQAIFGAGFIIITARWLNEQLFPLGERGGPLDYPNAIRARIRRNGVSLGIGLAAVVVVTALMRNVGAGDTATGVIILPVQVVLAVILFRLGWLLRHAPLSASADGTSGRVRTLVGLSCMIVAVATPLLAAAGFAAASDALFAPAVMTLAILGVIIVLQRLVYDIYAPDDGTGDSGALMPVLIGIGLFLLAVPVLALIWGARVTDLLEVWAQFRAGFQIGETQISPTDFMTFVLLFGGGYVLTQFVKRQLRTTILPRTKLDLGGQNAIAAGVGYIGITVAALIAITTAGINLSSLAIVAGALSVGIGFGLQTIVQNFVSGIILLIERPIAEGDMIEVNGQVGFVRNISVRSTRIETFDRTDVIVPNADLIAGQVTNWTRGNLAGRLILPVGVAYGSDVDAVRRILLEVANAHPMVIAEPGPQALFMAFGESSLSFELRMILRDVNWKVSATDEMNREINRRFAEAGIAIAFPQRDLWLRNPEVLRGPVPAPAQNTPAQDPAVPDAATPRTAAEARSVMTSADMGDTGGGDADGGAR